MGIRLSYANVVSTLALALALGGTSYAAVQITTKDIKDSAVTSAKIKDATVRNRDLARNAVGTLKVRDGGITKADLAPGVIPAKSGDAELLDGLDSAAFQRAGAAAGGVLAGTFPNPTLAPRSVTPGALGVVPAVKVRRTTDLAITFANDGTAVAWDEEIFDTADLHSNALLPLGIRSRLTAPVAGIYLVTASFQHEQTGGLAVSFRRNGVTAGPELATMIQHIDDSVWSFTTFTRLDAGDYLQAIVNPTLNPIDLVRGTTESMAFGMVWLGPAE